MRQTLKRFVKLTAGYSPVTLLGPLLMIFLTPLYTRALEPADYGVVDVSLTLFSLISGFLMLAMDQALNAHFFDGDDTYQRNLVTTALIYVSASGLLMTAMMAIVAVPLAQTLFKDPGRRYIIYLLSVSTTAGTAYSLLNTALRLRMSVKHVNTLGIAFLLTTVVNNILFVLVLRMKATGVVAATTLTNLIACGLALILANNVLRGSFSTRILKPLIRTGASLVPGAITGFLLLSVDRLLLTQYVSPSDIGLYSIANKLATMLYVLFSAAWSAWWPLALQMAGKPDTTRQYAQMFEYFIASSMLVSLALGTFAPEILILLTRRAYVPAAPYALALMVYFGPLSFAFSSFQIGLYVKKKTHLISVLFAISATVNIALNLLLDPLIGVWGAVWATVLSGGVLSTIAYFVSQQIFPVDYRLGRLFGLSAIYIGLTATFLLLPEQSFPLKVGALFLFVITIVATGIVTLTQIKTAIILISIRISKMAQRNSM